MRFVAPVFVRVRRDGGLATGSAGSEMELRNEVADARRTEMSWSVVVEWKVASIFTGMLRPVAREERSATPATRATRRCAQNLLAMWKSDHVRLREELLLSLHCKMPSSLKTRAEYEACWSEAIKKETKSIATKYAEELEARADAAEAGSSLSRVSRVSQQSRASQKSQQSRVSQHSRASQQSRASRASQQSRVSAMPNLAAATGDDDLRSQLSSRLSHVSSRVSTDSETERKLAKLQAQLEAEREKRKKLEAELLASKFPDPTVPPAAEASA